MKKHLKTYSEELSKTLGFKPAVLGIMITETIDPKSGLCEKTMKGSSIVFPVMPELDFIEYERRSLSPKFIDSAYYNLISNEFICHSENHEVEIFGVLVFINRPGFQEEFNKHTERLEKKIITNKRWSTKDEDLSCFYRSMRDCKGNPINYRFEYIKGLEIAVPDWVLMEKYLLTGEICEDCGGIIEGCCK